MNWISDFVDLSGLDKLELINKFSLSTAEVENEIFFKGSDLSGIVVAEIMSVENHPESKKLHLLKVDAGEPELTDVVCGAPNVRVGMKTAFAKVGAKIGEIEIAPRKLAGYLSCGMCCSEKELGLSDDNNGIMDLDVNLKNGTDLKEIFEIDDIVFEVDNKSLTTAPTFGDTMASRASLLQSQDVSSRRCRLSILNSIRIFPSSTSRLRIRFAIAIRHSALRISQST